ncbi:peptidase inhibitor family I36 protein [Micromonospora orduensis]|uniref:peptidase inhibitor family I36 protein n=1 Tax=Micromonospora orduensis TaxID=1420891 RepID=UPI00142E9BCA|nr:peptidase inhibitor family I36 protein [Micromonospora orduensis]
MRSTLRRLTSALVGAVALTAAFGVAPSPAQAASYPCNPGLLCLYAGTNFTGDVLYLDGPYNGCNDVGLPSYFRNQTQSIINNRPSGTVSTFWDNANATGLLGYQHAYGYRANLAYDTAAIGGNWNKRIEAVRVC